MKINEVIRKYRKEKQMTQEEMARYLGVTAPAVNKWENGNTYPDITLLPPIARLLGISVDTLLSYKERLTDAEINNIVSGISEKVMQDYRGAFEQSMEYIKEYPNDNRLILFLVQVLDGYGVIFGDDAPDEACEASIKRLYIRLLSDETFQYRDMVITSLFTKCLSSEAYEEAQQYLEMLPERTINPNALRANLYTRQGKQEEACQIYEKQLFGAGQDILGALNGLFTLAKKENSVERAKHIRDVQKQIVKALEMGAYMEASFQLEFAVWQKDKEECFRLMEVLLDQADHMAAFRHSELYQHIPFKEGSDLTIMKTMLRKGLEEDESIGFLKEDKRFEKLKKKMEDLVS